MIGVGVAILAIVGVVLAAGAAVVGVVKSSETALKTAELNLKGTQHAANKQAESAIKVAQTQAQSDIKQALIDQSTSLQLAQADLKAGEKRGKDFEKMVNGIQHEIDLTPSNNQYGNVGVFKSGPSYPLDGHPSRA